MTHPQTKELTKQVALEYLGEHWKDKLSNIQAGIWEKTFKPWDFKLAKEATRQLFIEHPAYRNDFNYRMPDPDLLKEFYVQISTPRHVYCPCCGRTGWIFFVKLDRNFRCDCSSPDIDMGRYTISVTTLLQKFPDNPAAKCDNFECRPTKEFLCPLGTQYYNVKKVEWMRRVKKDPNYQRGLKLLKGGRIKDLLENLEAEIDGIPDQEDHQEMEKYESDPPGSGEDTIPF